MSHESQRVEGHPPGGAQPTTKSCCCAFVHSKSLASLYPPPQTSEAIPHLALDATRDIAVHWSFASADVRWWAVTWILPNKVAPPLEPTLLGLVRERLALGLKGVRAEVCAARSALAVGLSQLWRPLTAAVRGGIVLPTAVSCAVVATERYPRLSWWWRQWWRGGGGPVVQAVGFHREQATQCAPVVHLGAGA